MYTESTGFTQIHNGVLVKTPSGQIKVEVVLPSVIHVVFTTQIELLPTWNPAVLKKEWPHTKFKTIESKAKFQIETNFLSVTLAKETGAVTFFDKDGGLLLAELPEGGKSLDPCEVSGQKTLAPTAVFLSSEEENFYGLGQHQFGRMNLRGANVRIWQYNTEIGIPFLLSSRGYGILWNNTYMTTVSPGINDKTVWHSEGGSAVDYYFFYGSDYDSIISNYQELTGRAPLPPKWALGLFQSRNRYSSPETLYEIAEGYRERHIPSDVLVIDWQYWNYWGECEFNRKVWSDPIGMFQHLLKQHFYVMISVWPKVDERALDFGSLLKGGYLLKKRDGSLATDTGQMLYDPTTQRGRECFWKRMKKLLDYGVAAWWLDASEPDFNDYYKLYSAGTGAKVHNTYPLLHTQAVYEGQRNDVPNQRVFILTRSAFAGQQRNGAASWSGDISATFEALRRQIPAGLNFAMCGIPYWTTDIGGYFRVGTVPFESDYQELYIRWYEFGTFCPIFRTHGESWINEPWSYGPKVEAICKKYSSLRYQLMPYIYSLSWLTSTTGRPIMRAMVMDFGDDAKTTDLKEQFMFGPSLLIAPIVNKGEREKMVYLPDTSWYDFWTGEKLSGGKTITVSAPLDHLPIFARAGTIVPVGPFIEYIDEKSLNPLTLNVYSGDDAEFMLYEDDGLTYGYERGEYVTTRIVYSEKDKTLHILPGKTTFNGKLPMRCYEINFVGLANPVGVFLNREPLLQKDIIEKGEIPNWCYSRMHSTITVWSGPRLTEEAFTANIK